MNVSKKSAICFLFALCFLKGAYALDLSTHRWKHRPLVISKDASELWKKQQSALVEADLKERDIVVLFDKDESESFKAILYGKDGLKKLESKTPVSQEDLNSLIDSMPMRQSEMRKVAP